MSTLFILIIAFISLSSLFLIFWNRSHVIRKAKKAIFHKSIQQEEKKKKHKLISPEKNIQNKTSEQEKKYSIQDIKKGISRAEILIEHKEEQEAEKILISILAVEEKHLQAHIILASLYLKRKQYSRAEALYRDLISLLNQNTPATLSNLAFCLFEQGKVKESVQFYEQAIEKDPQNIKRYSNLAQVLFVLRDFNSAINLFKKALKINPKDTELLFMLADTYRESNDFAEAKAVYKKILDHEPYNALANEEVAKLKMAGY